MRKVLTLALFLALTTGCDFGLGSSWSEAWGGGWAGGAGGGGGGGSSSLITLSVETVAFTAEVDGVRMELDALDHTSGWMEATGPDHSYAMFVWRSWCEAGDEPDDSLSIRLWDIESLIRAPPEAAVGSEGLLFGPLCTELRGFDAEPSVHVSAEGATRRVVIDAEGHEGGSLHAELVYTLECGVRGLPCCNGRSCFDDSRCSVGMCGDRSWGVSDAGSSDAGSSGAVSDGGVAEDGGGDAGS